MIGRLPFCLLIIYIPMTCLVFLGRMQYLLLSTISVRLLRLLETRFIFLEYF